MGDERPQRLVVGDEAGGLGLLFVRPLQQVAADTKLDQSLRDLALIRQTAFEYDTLKPETVIARMKPMVDAKDPASSWFASAAELSATAHYQLGQFDQAGALYGRIAKLPDVTRSLQSRSVQMAGMLGVDAKRRPKAGTVTNRCDTSKERLPTSSFNFSIRSSNGG